MVTIAGSLGKYHRGTGPEGLIFSENEVMGGGIILLDGKLH